MYSLVDLPRDVLVDVSSHLGFYELANLSAVGKIFRFCARAAKKKLFKHEFIKTAKLYDTLKDIENYPFYYIEEFIFPTHDVCDTYNRWEKKHGIIGVMALENTCLDYLEKTRPHISYRKHDPETYDLIAEDIVIGAPFDLPIVLGFYLKVLRNVYINGSD